jgi:drug/metabolite transporter (DMT)-like permease
MNNLKVPLEEVKSDSSRGLYRKSDYSVASTFVLVNSFEFLFSITVAISQFSTQTLGVTILEFAWARTWCNLLVATLLCVKKQVGPFKDITRDMWLPLSLRCILGNIGFVSLTYSFKHLPLSVGTVIIATSPFAVAIMASLFLDDEI